MSTTKEIYRNPSFVFLTEGKIACLVSFSHEEIGTPVNFIFHKDEKPNHIIKTLG